MSTAGTSRTPLSATPITPALEENIRRRAYELFLGRGAGHGHDLEDWLQAEKELAQPAPTPTPISIATGRKPRARKK